MHLILYLLVKYVNTMDKFTFFWYTINIKTRFNLLCKGVNMSLRISTKGIYGLRIMAYLAEKYGCGLVTVKEIALTQSISEKYLEQIITKLNKAGFLESARGAYGGYKLIIEPNKILVGSILRALEGDLSPTICVSDGAISCEQEHSCATIKVWQEIKIAVDNVVDNITLSDMIKKCDNAK